MLKKKYNKLTPNTYIGGKSKNWECLCDCGNSRIVAENSLIKGYAKSCGCLQRKKQYGDLTGKKYNKLTIIEKTYSKRLKKAWKCLCDCGNIAIFETSNIVKGVNLSCGKCIKKIYPDLTGQQFGYWTLLSRDASTPHIKYNCKCICGKEKSIFRSTLTDEKFIGHCGCITKAKRTLEQNQRNLLRSNRTKIMKRDNYTCQLCGIKHYTYRLKSHHIYPFKHNEERRLDSTNLIALCSKCHIKVHGPTGFTGIDTTFQQILKEIIDWIITEPEYDPIKIE